MGPVQFFLFGLFFAWFTGTGKLKALITALMAAPVAAASAGGAAITGLGSLPSAPTGNPLDLNNPRNIITGDPLGLN